jgi:hypothetical protein
MNKFIRCVIIFTAPFITSVCVANDDLALLDSLLARGLIAPSDYQEQKQLLDKSTKKQSNPLAAKTSIAKGTESSVTSTPNDIYLLKSEQIILASNDQTSNNHKNTHSEHNENHFVGPYIVLTNEWKRASAKVSGEKISKSELAASLGLGYTFGLSPSHTLGIKLSGDFRSGEYGSGDVASVATKVIEKHHYSVAVEPGYVVNPQLLVFGILAYHTAVAEIEGGTESARTNGVGYGIGFKHAIADHLFLMGDLQRVNYGEKTIDGFTVKPSSTVGAIGLGYHF